MTAIGQGAAAGGAVRAANRGKLSISIVCKDNQDTIGRTLDSIKGLGDEIIAVDSGSTDGTIALLEAAGAKIIAQEWLGYVRQKQFALDNCAHEWVLHVDSDESLTPELYQAIARVLINADAAVLGYAVNRKIFYAGAMLEHAWQPEWRLRLVCRQAAQWTGYDPHDYLTIRPGIAGQTARLPGDLRHDAIPSIAAFLARQVSHSTIAAASYRAMGRRARKRDLMVSPAGQWIKQMIIRSAWRDGWRGWVAAAAATAAALMKHAILLELTHRPGGTDDDEEAVFR